MDKTMFGGRSLFYSALSSAEGRRLDSIETEVLCPGDRWSSSNEPFPPFLFPFFTPSRLCRVRFVLVPKGSACSRGGGEDVDRHGSLRSPQMVCQAERSVLFVSIIS